VEKQFQANVFSGFLRKESAVSEDLIVIVNSKLMAQPQTKARLPKFSLEQKGEQKAVLKRMI